MRQHAQQLLRQMLGSQAVFRPGQWEAVEAVALRRERALVVQKTGWGKSLVYFLATKLLREQGSGPTLLVSPLLSLMRNQIAMASRIGLEAVTIHSGNRNEWDSAESALATGACDLLLISPERLSNDRFRQLVLDKIAGRVGMLVIDEVHCISDWGHDFRPDYRRIARILQLLPSGVPVLGTTATANDRVVADVQAQLGADLTLLRGPLARESLRLQNIPLADQGQRLAWLAENLPRLPGSGIVYCLTQADTERVAGWLNTQGITAAAYHAGNDGDIDRVGLEQALLENRLKAIVATVALGMGFDKPDLGFVVHFQRPGSVVAYYQQVGRAGRALERAYGILLGGEEDDEIQEYFINSAFPSVQTMLDILALLERVEGLTINQLLETVNIPFKVAEQALKLLEVDGAVGRDARSYFRTPNPWRPDIERMRQVTQLRRDELAQMQAYMVHPGCLMEFLARALDDPLAGPCGRCANCVRRGLPLNPAQHLVAAAVEYLKLAELVIEPRKQWPAGLFPDQKRNIPPQLSNAPGRSLCQYGDAGWGRMVQDGKYKHQRFDDALVQAAAQLIVDRWQPEPYPEWVTSVPSRRHPQLVSDFARRLASALHLPYLPALTCSRQAPEQKTMANSSQQARNVADVFSVTDHCPNGPVLLVDDITDSRWTLTMAGCLLRQQGVKAVYPFTLARAATGKAKP